MQQRERVQILWIPEASSGTGGTDGLMSLPSQRLRWTAGQSARPSAYTFTMLWGRAWASPVWGVQLIRSLQGGILLLFGSCSPSFWTAVWLIFLWLWVVRSHPKGVSIMWLSCLPVDITVMAYSGVHFVKSKKLPILYALYSTVGTNLLIM